MENREQFPRSITRGPGEGFWWAFVTMTTVGLVLMVNCTILINICFFFNICVIGSIRFACRFVYERVQNNYQVHAWSTSTWSG